MSEENRQGERAGEGSDLRGSVEMHALLANSRTTRALIEAGGEKALRERAGSRGEYSIEGERGEWGGKQHSRSAGFHPLLSTETAEAYAGTRE